MSGLKLFLLGAPHIERESALVEVERRKVIALIAYLAVTGQEHSRDALATLLWPNADQGHARGALRRDISVLNKTLGAEWLDVEEQAVGLRRSVGLWMDLEQFHNLLAVCRMHGHPEAEVCSACIASLTEAVTLYRDDFLAGFTLRDSPAFDEWQFFHTERLRRELAGALERLARGHSAQAEFDMAIGYARRWLALDSLHEPAHRHLMQLYAWSGQRNAALRQYVECVRVLERELGAPPRRRRPNCMKRSKKTGCRRSRQLLGSSIEERNQQVRIICRLAREVRQNESGFLHTLGNRSPRSTALCAVGWWAASVNWRWQSHSGAEPSLAKARFCW